MLQTKNIRAGQGKVNVAVVLLRHLSNFTDFNVLERDPRVHLFYTNNTDELMKADIILLPGSKSTLSDLYELRRNGVAQAIVRAHREGATVMGICGGYQLMGREDGYFVDRTCMGTYVHGILDNPSVIDYLLEPFADKLKETAFDYKAFKEEQYDKLAAHVRKHVDLPLIYQILTDND